MTSWVTLVFCWLAKIPGVGVGGPSITLVATAGYLTSDTTVGSMLVLVLHETSSPDPATAAPRTNNFLIAALREISPSRNIENEFMTSQFNINPKKCKLWVITVSMNYLPDN